MKVRIEVCLVLIAILVFAMPIQANAKVQPDEIDELFQLIVDEWANPHNITWTNLRIWVDSPKLPPSANETNIEQLNRDFLDAVIDAEGVFGNLAEYWELRALIDLRPEDVQRADPDGDSTYSSDTFPFALYSIENRTLFNPVHLQKALEMDPTHGSARWFIGLAEMEELYPERPKDSEGENKYYGMKADIYAECGAAEPENAFYPYFEAATRHRLGQDDRIMELIDKAASCEYFALPQIFPFSHAPDYIEDFRYREGVFADITPAGRLALFSAFYNLGGNLPNYLIAKNMVKDILAKTATDKASLEAITKIHRIGCLIGATDNADSIHPLVGNVIVKFCLRKGLEIAEETGDVDLKLSLIAMTEKLYAVRESSRFAITGVDSVEAKMHFIFMAFRDYTIETLEELGLEDFSYMSEWAAFRSPVILSQSFSHYIHRELIIPALMDLATFEYTNPTEWYDAWYLKHFPPPME